jgi:hypothetical protein
MSARTVYRWAPKLDRRGSLRYAGFGGGRAVGALRGHAAYAFMRNYLAARTSHMLIIGGRRLGLVLIWDDVPVAQQAERDDFLAGRASSHDYPLGDVPSSTEGDRT